MAAGRWQVRSIDSQSDLRSSSSNNGAARRARADFLLPPSTAHSSILTNMAPASRLPTALQATEQDIQMLLAAQSHIGRVPSKISESRRNAISG